MLSAMNLKISQSLDPDVFLGEHILSVTINSRGILIIRIGIKTQIYTSTRCPWQQFGFRWIKAAVMNVPAWTFQVSMSITLFQHLEMVVKHCQSLGLPVLKHQIQLGKYGKPSCTHPYNHKISAHILLNSILNWANIPLRSPSRGQSKWP